MRTTTLRCATRSLAIRSSTSRAPALLLCLRVCSSTATAISSSSGIASAIDSSSTSTSGSTIPPPSLFPASLPPDDTSAMAGKGSVMRAGKRPVPEANRISMAERLEQFRASPDQQMTFEAGLSNHERAVIHGFCRKMGMKSKSHGKGEARRLTVYKIGGLPQKDNSVVTPLSFSAEAQAAIQHLFTCFPPGADDASWKLDEFPASEGQKSNFRKSKEHAPSGDKNIMMRQSDIAKQVAMLGARIRSMPSLQQISQERAKLPIAKFKDEITAAVEKNQVVLIAGETGCGKTTQVPQFILDHQWSLGQPCRILCTQPRRISAISVAERIAMERGETIGETVGYQIKLEAKGGNHSSLMFCTNGVLLRKLVNADAEDANPSIEATHIIVDEIHERDCFADFMLIALRDLLLLKPELRLVLMSATLDAELFSGYFNNCPVIRVPGFTYPVQTFYLEDVIIATEVGEDSIVSAAASDKQDMDSPLNEDDAAAMDEAISLAWLEDDFELLMEMLARSPSKSLCDYQHSLAGATALMVASAKGKSDLVLLLLSRGADINLSSNDGTTALDWAERGGQQEVKDLLLKHKERNNDPAWAIKKAELLEKYLSSIDQEEVDTELIEQLLRKICTTTTAGFPPDQNGAVLVFLPGWEDITRLRERLQASPLFGDTRKFLLLPLHSMIPSIEQKQVFKSPPPGVRKIVLATNIAETAITINDIIFVIDSGRVKEKSYDPYSNVATLQTSWISKASARQREGRAGRCQSGVCYHLYSKTRADALPDFQVPEIKRTPLEELCLQVKLLDSSFIIKDFLSKAVDPPNELSIRNAINLLCDIGALTPDERLTELGRQLGSLPVHPSTSKMLLLGILLNCLDPALTIACAAGYRDPFVLPTGPDQRRRAFAAKKELASEYGGYSDHLAIVSAFDHWEQAKSRGFEKRFCEQKFLSAGTMTMLAGMRQQLQRELARKGLIPQGPHPCSLNARDPGIVRALLVAGLYPMVGCLLPPLPNRQKSVVQTAQGLKVRIHPHSANFHLVNNDKRQENLNRPILVFDEVTRGEAWMYIRNSSLVKPHPLLLLALEMVVAPLDTGSNDLDEEDERSDGSDEEDEATDQQQEDLMSNPNTRLSVVVDRWLKFEATAVEAAQIYCLRERLAAAIAFKIRNPRKVLPPVLGNSLFAIACLFSYDGAFNDVMKKHSSASSAMGSTSTSTSDFSSLVTAMQDEPATESHQNKFRKAGHTQRNLNSSNSGKLLSLDRRHSNRQGQMNTHNFFLAKKSSSHYTKRQRGNNFG